MKYREYLRKVQEVHTYGRAINRHYEKVKRKKKHPASKCRQPKCFVCSGQKVYKVQNRQTMQINDDTIQQLQELNIKRKQKWTKMRQ